MTTNTAQPSSTPGEKTPGLSAPSGLPTTPSELSRQLRQVITASQQSERRPSSQVFHRLLTAEAARLAALVEASARLTPRQLARLRHEIQSQSDLTLRADLLARLTARLPADNRRDMVERLWADVNHVQDPAVRAQVLFQLVPLVSEAPYNAPSAFMAVFDIARSIDNTEARTRSLIALSRYVQPDMALSIQADILNTVNNMQGNTARTNTLASLAEHLQPALTEDALACAMRITAPDERARAVTALARALPAEMVSQVQGDVLRAIEGIKGEEARVEALIAFTPYLDYAQDWNEFPAVLERALAIAVNMPRRQFRAKALVALAPHLPSELQGEALAAVHSLPNEHDRADMLATLAAELPPNMLVASLAVAHTMEQQDARVHALSALARYVPERARQQTTLDALTATQHLTRNFERIVALVNLLDILPPPLQEQALLSALESARLITNTNTKARALQILSRYLPDHLIGRALDIAHTLDDPQKRLAALASLVERLPENAQIEQLKTMLAIVREIRYEYRQARAVLSIAGLLPPALINNALTLVKHIEEPYDQLSALIALAQNTPPAKRPALVGAAWRLIKKVESGYDRASALAAIAPLLPPAAETDLTRAVGMAIGSIMDEYDQASAIILLAPLLAPERAHPQPNALPDKTLILRDGLRAALQMPGQTERAALFAEGVAVWMHSVPYKDRDTHDYLWTDTLQRLASLPLPDALLCIGQLIPLIERLVGAEAVGEIARLLALPDDE